MGSDRKNAEETQNLFRNRQVFGMMSSEELLGEDFEDRNRKMLNQGWREDPGCT